MRVRLTEKTAKDNLNQQLMRGMKKLMNEGPQIDLTLDELLRVSKVNRKRFFQYYKSQVDFLHSINGAFVNRFKEKIPYVKTKADLEFCTENLIEMTTANPFIKEAKIIFQLNKEIQLGYFHSLRRQIIGVLNTRMHVFFKQLKRQTSVLDIDEFKETFYSVMEDSIINDELKKFHLLVYSLKTLNVVFD